MVVDASAALGLLLAEKHAHWVADRLEENAAHLLMTAVNLAEVLIVLHDRKPRTAARLENQLLRTGLAIVPVDRQLARLAARARLRYPLNLGDCFCYALAAQERLPILTLDADFRKLDVQVMLPPAGGGGP